MPAKFDRYEADVSCRLSDFGFGPDVVDFAGKRRLKPGIFRWTETKNETAARFFSQTSN